MGGGAGEGREYSETDKLNQGNSRIILLDYDVGGDYDWHMKSTCLVVWTEYDNHPPPQSTLPPLLNHLLNLL